MNEGVNVVGADPASDLALPAGPRRAGTVTLTEGRAVADGDFLHDGVPVSDLRLESDADGDPTMLELGPLRLCVIERGGRLALRTWDTDAPQRREFHGIDHWPVDAAWRLDGQLEPTPGRILRVPDVLGVSEEQESPGDVSFELEGTTHRLQALRGGPSGDLWLVFGDLTNGRETYAGGRFLYTDAPDADGRVTVDFNRSYNPPCVFSPYATCPLPWPENRLPVRIEAGERMYERGQH